MLGGCELQNLSSYVRGDNDQAKNANLKPNIYVLFLSLSKKQARRTFT